MSVGAQILSAKEEEDPSQRALDLMRMRSAGRDLVEKLESSKKKKVSFEIGSNIREQLIRSTNRMRSQEQDKHNHEFGRHWADNDKTPLSRLESSDSTWENIEITDVSKWRRKEMSAERQKSKQVNDMALSILKSHVHAIVAAGKTGQNWLENSRINSKKMDATVVKVGNSSTRRNSSKRKTRPAYRYNEGQKNRKPESSRTSARRSPKHMVNRRTSYKRAQVTKLKNLQQVTQRRNGTNDEVDGQIERRLSDGFVQQAERRTDPGPHPGPVPHSQMIVNERNVIPDWTDNATKGSHMFLPINTTESCYFPPYRCKEKSSSPRIKCVSCRIVVHAACEDILKADHTNCRSTYREPLGTQIGINPGDEQCRHHWNLRKRWEGCCMLCNKNFEKNRFFSSTDNRRTDYRAISCSWCKETYHYSQQCFKVEDKLNEPCNMGKHWKLIVPPYWIVKTRRSTRPYRKKSKGDKASTTSLKKYFVIRPKNDYEDKTPLLVFINPKSGGNQGRKVLTELQYLLNPRQVFDLSQGGPIPTLELYKRVPNLRILCCGGDGTCGWVMSAIDEVGFRRNPPVAILPLGTGNDLSRSLNWGPGYSDNTSLTKFLSLIEKSHVDPMDRWNIESCDPKIPLPLNVMNNYFSIGVDATACLKFHSEREANPEKFNSRIGNIIKYANYGMAEFFRFNAPARELWKHVKITCDGVNLTKKLTDLHAVNLIVLNIPYYSAGYQPWGTPSSSEFTDSRISDSKFEVVACSQQQYANLYVGKGNGQRIAQAKDIKVQINIALAGQIDGEATMIQPTTIHIYHRNKHRVLLKSKQEIEHSPQHKYMGECQLLTVKEVRRSESDTTSLDQSDSSCDMVEVELGPLSLPLDIDLETNRCRIESFLKGKCSGEDDFHYIGYEDNYEPLQKCRELTLLRDFLDDRDILRIRRDIQHCHIDSKDKRCTSLSSGFEEDLAEDSKS